MHTAVKVTLVFVVGGCILPTSSSVGINLGPVAFLASKALKVPKIYLLCDVA